MILREKQRFVRCFSIVEIMPQSGMSNEATHCDNFSSIGKSSKLSLTSGKYLVVKIKDVTVEIKMPISLSASVVVLGDKSASVNTAASSSQTFDENGVVWK